ncbi:Zinc finger GATA-type [Arabidopsis suecica]|uniref:GATA transcription factor n=1 Tax=Arabidopsis suecica TaxID=45249 RepID=A0A8T1YGS5_ARASU|nr:Zinc finger GATA-type [Arabidopsis suecica]
MERLTSELFLVAGNTDSFVVDDLLDFSNDDGEIDDGFDTLPDSSALSTGTLTDSSNSSSLFTDVTGFSDLCVPRDDIAELEWLSNFVEESFSGEVQDKLHLLSGLKHPQTTGSTLTHLIKSEPEPDFDQFIDIDESNVAVPAKARSKRSRSAASTWASRLLSLADSDETNPKKKQRRVKEQDFAADMDVDCGETGGGRRCLHCATEKTPQWRTGPMGPKTLCNACGVRYKSGRLVPEYRPASSPTFVMARHSNSHRKVMELRRQKEMRDEHLLSQLRCENLLMDIRSNGEDFVMHNNNNHVASDFRHLI